MKKITIFLLSAILLSTSCSNNDSEEIKTDITDNRPPIPVRFVSKFYQVVAWAFFERLSY